MFNVKWMSISWSQLGRGAPDEVIYIQFPKTIFLFSYVLLCSLCFSLDTVILTFVKPLNGLGKNK